MGLKSGRVKPRNLSQAVYDLAPKPVKWLIRKDDCRQGLVKFLGERGLLEQRTQQRRALDPVDAAIGPRQPVGPVLAQALARGLGQPPAAALGARGEGPRGGPGLLEELGLAGLKIIFVELPDVAIADVVDV